MKPIKSEEFLDDLNELRVFVLQECDDGKFRQVGLTDKQYKKLTELCLTRPPWKDDSLKDGYEMSEIKLNPDWEIDPDHFLGLSPRYSAKEMEDENTA